MTSVCCAIRLWCVTLSALGSLVVPLLKRRVAAVEVAVAWSEKRCQSLVPWERSHCQSCRACWDCSGELCVAASLPGGFEDHDA
ncbi:hypothetical protein IWZ03DRAFT_368821 [Phyllosticta citriasiana]|uniref:Secreted protein n=1 Tax=Phyllosticta citriasiana TaxID=595635 RepID=A0ABR1KY81_9PEZI